MISSGWIETQGKRIRNPGRKDLVNRVDEILTLNVVKGQDDSYLSF